MNSVVLCVYGVQQASRSEGGSASSLSKSNASCTGFVSMSHMYFSVSYTVTLIMNNHSALLVMLIEMHT